MNNPAKPVEDNNFNDIEISEIIRCIWKQRITVLLFTGLGLSAALTYVLLANPVYETSTSIRPVDVADLDELNSSGLYRTSPLESLKSIGSSMESYDVRLRFFMNNSKYLMPYSQPGRTVEQAFEDFNKTSIFSLKQIDSTKSTSLSDSIELSLR